MAQKVGQNAGATYLNAFLLEFLTILRQKRNTETKLDKIDIIFKELQFQILT